MASSHPAQSRHRECAMCMEKFTSPRLLACFHTFCLGCLRQLAQKYEGSASFPCPSCRTTIYIPAGGVEKFQVNFYIEAEVEGQYAKAATARTCEMCGKGSATHKCSDCGQFSCDACTEIHASIKATRSHTVLNLQHAQAAGSLPGLTVTKERYCKIHKEENIRFFCTQCSAVICRDCKLTSHEGHACTDLSNKSAEAKSLIFQVTDRAHNKLEPMLRAALQNATSHKADGQTRKQEIESTLERRAEELIKEIEGSLAKAKENLNREASHVDQTASLCIDHMSQELTCFISFTEHAQRVAESGCDADVLEISSEMKQFFGIASKVASRSLNPYTKPTAQLHASIQLKSFTSEDWNTVIQLGEDNQIRCNSCSQEYDKHLNCCPIPQCVNPGKPNYSRTDMKRRVFAHKQKIREYRNRNSIGASNDWCQSCGAQQADPLTTIKTAIPQFIGHVTRSRPLQEKEEDTVQNKAVAAWPAELPFSYASAARQPANQGTDVKAKTFSSEITSEIGAIQSLLSGDFDSSN